MLRLHCATASGTSPADHTQRKVSVRDLSGHQRISTCQVSWWQFSSILRDWRSHKNSHDRQIRKLSLDPFWPFPFSEASLTPLTPHPSTPPPPPTPLLHPLPQLHLHVICRPILCRVRFVKRCYLFWFMYAISDIASSFLFSRCMLSTVVAPASDEILAVFCILLLIGDRWNPLLILHPVADRQSMESSPNPTPCCWLAVDEILSESYTLLLTGGRWNPLWTLHTVADWTVDEILSESYTLLLTGGRWR